MKADPESARKLPGEDGNIMPALWGTTVAGLVLAAFAAFLFGRGAIVSSAIGSVLAVFNLWSIGRMVRGFLGGAGARSWGPLGMLKLVLLFAVLGVIIKQGLADILPLAFGYAALPVGIVLAQLRSAPPVREEN